MSDNNSILSQLLENNPFASTVSPLPFENSNPDLEQLNRAASEEIEQLIRYKRREPSVPLAGLIFGETGCGKTHMLMRILRRLRKNARPVIFVTVRGSFTFSYSQRVMHELLSEVIICLTKEHSGGHTQFDMLASAMMSAYNEHRKNDGFNDITNIEPRVYLKRDMPGIDRVFLKCMLLYLGTSDENIKSEILNWIRDGLDDEDSLRLGLPSRDINFMDNTERESSARNFLNSLGLVLAYAHMPMIICIDELDAIARKEDKEEREASIRAWGDAIGLFMNSLSGILPLSFMKTATWDVFQPVLDPSIWQRLRNNIIVMKSDCTEAQAKQMIHDRIAAAFSKGVEEKYNWLISRMNITQGLSPRLVIELAGKALKEPGLPIDYLKASYDEECKKVQIEQKAWPPNADHITRALETWLASQSNISLSKNSGKYIKLQGTHNNRKFAFIVLIPKIHSTGIAGLCEGIKFMREYPGSYCAYVLEEKAHKKTWKKFNEKLNEFQEKGGAVITLDKDTRIKWYGLTALINRIDNGDVNIHTSSQTRPATRDDLRTFLQTVKLPGLDFAGTKDSPAPAPVGVNSADLKKALADVVKISPMNIITVDKAIHLLAQKNIYIGRNELLSFVKDNRTVFKTFNSRNDILITLQKS